MSDLRPEEQVKDMAGLVLHRREGRARLRRRRLLPPGRHRTVQLHGGGTPSSLGGAAAGADGHRSKGDQHEARVVAAVERRTAKEEGGGGIDVGVDVCDKRRRQCVEGGFLGGERLRGLRPLVRELPVVGCSCDRRCRSKDVEFAVRLRLHAALPR